MTLQSEFAATLVDELCRAGIRDVVVAPGSRSSPLAIALVSEERLRVHVRLDERSGAFFAVGTALASSRPGVIVTTSGTASAEVHAAVLEADLARVPLIVLTADRPPELHGVGAPQTVEQVGLYGRATRYSCSLPIPDEENRPFWRSMASRLVVEALQHPNGPGPVHCNVPLREPLVGPIGTLHEGRPGGAPWHDRSTPGGLRDEALDRFVASVAASHRGLFVCGGGAFASGEEESLLRLAEALGWPVLADGRAFPRSVRNVIVAHGDAVLRSSRAKAFLRPEVVVHVGSPHASRILSAYFAEIAQHGVRHLLVDPASSFEDPERITSVVFSAPPATLFAAARSRLGATRPDPEWLASWRLADDAAEHAIATRIDGAIELSEPGVARQVVSLVPPGTTVFCSSSMPVRDVEWFAPARAGAPRVLANRGANGIDGVVSTVLGVACSSKEGAPVVGLLGDLAFFYDLSGLVFGVAERVPDVTLVVIDNAGGGIFSFLAYPGILEKERFERAFATPQAPQLRAVAEALGAKVTECATSGEFAAAFPLVLEKKGIQVVLVHTDRNANVQLHEVLNEDCIQAVESALESRTTHREPARPQG